jgi:hypothetical protein
MVIAVKKGNRLEYEVVWDLNNSGLDPMARRSSKGGVRNKDRVNRTDGDIYTKLPFCIECKFHEKLKGFYSHWDQAVEENTAPGRRASVLVVKAANKPKLAVMDFENWQELVACALKGGLE